jgi:hypothetical protein
MSLPLNDQAGEDFPPGTPDEYRALPRSVRDLHPPESWMWLSGEQKDGLVQGETEPEA